MTKPNILHIEKLLISVKSQHEMEIIPVNI